MKVGIIGLGMVGKEILHYIYHFMYLEELVIFDLNQDRVQGEVWDFEDTKSTLFHMHKHKLTIAKSYADFKDCDVVISTISKKQTPEAVDRDAFLHKNGELIRDLALEAKKYFSHAWVIMVSNPVEAMTYQFLKYSGMNPDRVISSGTYLDSLRLRVALHEILQVSPQDVQAWILGEHGSTSFIPWSLVSVAGVREKDLEKVFQVSFSREELLQKVLRRGLDIFEVRAYTDHGIGASVATILKNILYQEGQIMALGRLIEKPIYGIEGVVLNLPLRADREKGLQVVPFVYSDQEIEALHISAKKIKSLQESLSTS